ILESSILSRRSVMASPVCDQLGPVRRRQRWICAVQWAVWGLAGSSLVAIGLELARSTDWLAISTWAIWGVLISGPLLAGFAGLVSRHSWQAAAVAVDTHYQLKDRSLTALAFIRKPGQPAWSQLQ